MLQCIQSLRLRAQRRRRFDQALIELRRHSDRELCELGISPVDIRRIARELAFAASK
jgi:uncharacterized protein YjiS (DUF1127 family)